MAVEVIVVLEMVDVDEEQGERGFRADRPIPFMDVYFVEPAPVGNVGQSVEGGQVFEQIAVFLSSKWLRIRARMIGGLKGLRI
jgi:hypothetical protein